MRLFYRVSKYKISYSLAPKKFGGNVHIEDSYKSEYSPKSGNDSWRMNIRVRNYTVKKNGITLYFCLILLFLGE